MAADITPLLDWLADHRGQDVAVEIGRRVPDGVSVLLKSHGMLGEVRDATDTGTGEDCLRVALDDDDWRSIYIHPSEVLEVKVHLDAVLVRMAGEIDLRFG